MTTVTGMGDGDQAFDTYPRDADPLVLTPRLTLLLFILYSSKFWYLHSPTVILSIGGLISLRLLQNPWLWFILGSFMASANYLNWYSVDNHKYLMNYWCFALALTFSAPERWRAAVLSSNARLLIGLCMAFAVVWKLMSPSYLDGSFFHFTLLSDPRFDHLARWFGGLSRETVSGNHKSLSLLTGGYLRGIELNVVELSDTVRLRQLATLFTWWTIGIEAALALGFLWRGGRVAEAARNTLLLVFGITTYLVAPVIGFGWLLMILGIAQCTPRSKPFIYAYLAVFCLIQLYTMPYGDVIEVMRR